MYQMEIPTMLMKTLATKEFLKRMKKTIPIDLWKWLMELDVRPNFWKAVVTSVTTRLGYSHPNFGHTKTINLMRMEGSKIQKKIDEILGKHDNINYLTDIYGNGARIDY